MIINRIEFTEGVRARAGLPASQPGHAEMMRFDAVIAAITLEEAARISLLPGTGRIVCSPVNVEWHTKDTNRYSGIIPLPSGCLKPLGMKLADGREITGNVIFPDDPCYWQRLSPFPEVSGSCSLPKLYAGFHSEGAYLELHECASALRGCSLVYIPRPEWDADENLELAFQAARLLEEAVTGKVVGLLEK